MLTTALARILQTAARRAGLRRAGRSLEPPRPRQVRARSIVPVLVIPSRIDNEIVRFYKELIRTSVFFA